MNRKSNITLILLVFQLLVACTITIMPRHTIEKKQVIKHKTQQNVKPKQISTPTPIPLVTPSVAPIIIVVPVSPPPTPLPTPTPSALKSPSKYYWAPFPKTTPTPEPHEN